MSIRFAVFLCVLASSGVVQGDDNVVVVESMAVILKGEWMVEFFAPWCSACKQFASTWESFGNWAAENKEQGVIVGKVDVTENTMLSGQFMITHLPTIFHIKDGVVRPFSKSRELSSLKAYLEEDQWKEVDPIPWWRSPTALHMRAVGFAFGAAEKVSEIQAYLEKNYNIPTYGVFIIIALGTIVVAVILAGIIIVCIEICMRSFHSGEPQARKVIKRRQKEGDETVVEKKKEQGKEEKEEEKEGEMSQTASEGETEGEGEGGGGKEEEGASGQETEVTAKEEPSSTRARKRKSKK